jgi:HEAT repeat protein
MTSPENRRKLVETLCEVLLNDPNPTVRLKAVESLRLIRAEEAIGKLCDAFKTDAALSVRLAAADAAVAINNPEAFKTMSETPKYDLRGALLHKLI